MDSSLDTRFKETVTFGFPRNHWTGLDDDDDDDDDDYEPWTEKWN